MTTVEQRRFPFLSEIETPAGAEDWREMYPYYFVPRGETDVSRQLARGWRR